jgi:uncharacterized membrane protein YkgB
MVKVSRTTRHPGDKEHMMNEEIKGRVELAPVEATDGRRGLWRRGNERGMVVAEYAVGVVLVIVLIGVVIAAVQQGWMGTLVQDLVTLLMKEIPRALGAG